MPVMEESMTLEEIGLVADRIWGELTERLPAAVSSLGRIRGVLDVWARRQEPSLSPKQGMQKTQRWFMPELPAAPWMDRDSFEPLASKLEALYPDLRSEILNEEALGGFRPYGHATDKPDVRPEWSPSGWDEVRLWEDFAPTLNVLRMPTAARALQAVIEKTTLINHVAFMAMKPGTRLPVHHDRTNWYVSIHLGIVVPPGCVLRVADEERTWEEGKCLFFDNSFAHEAWNSGDARRIIFAVYFAHPHLTPVECEALQFLQTRYRSLAGLGYEATMSWAQAARRSK